MVAGNGSGEALCAHFVPNKFLEGMPSEEKLKTLWFSSLEKRNLRGEPSLLTTASRAGETEGGAVPFSLVTSDRTDGNGTKVHQGRFRLGIRKDFFTVRVVKHWNRLTSEMVDAPWLSVSKSHLDNALNNVF